MKEGLLWYDDSPGHDLSEKIKRAARRYKQKFGTVPDVCYVHSSALNGNGNGKVQKVGGVRVSSRPTVLRHHFWVGREEKQRPRRKTKSVRN
jgi:hypothetical protein